MTLVPLRRSTGQQLVSAALIALIGLALARGSTAAIVIFVLAVPFGYRVARRRHGSTSKTSFAEAPIGSAVEPMTRTAERTLLAAAPVLVVVATGLFLPLAGGVVGGAELGEVLCLVVTLRMLVRFENRKRLRLVSGGSGRLIRGRQPAVYFGVPTDAG